MRRNLIKWEAFERIQKDSLSAAEHELFEASEVLAEALGVDQLGLNCYSDSNVIYETLDNTYVRADYALSHDHLTFENIEELVIDEETAAEASKQKISDLVEAILSNESQKADQILSDYMSSPDVRKTLMEGRKAGFVRDKSEVKAAAKTKSKNAGKSFIKARKRLLDAAPDANTGPRLKRGTFGSIKNDPKGYQKRYWKTRGKKQGRNVINAQGKVEKKKHCMKEFYSLAENVLGFVHYHNFGPLLQESVIHRDQKGNVVAVKMPTLKIRNENRILTLNHKHQIDSDVKVVREEAHGLATDVRFCKAVAELKRHNNFSDNEALKECLNNLVGQFPSVLYLSQTELSHTVAEALDTAGVANYDDQTCDFIAEGILRTAYDVFGDRVERILRFAQADVQTEGDAYVHFQDVVHKFFPTLDENYTLQMQVFTDLFNAVNEVWGLATEAGDAATVKDAETILEELSAIVDGQATADINLAEEVAEWLAQYVESNLEGGEWQIPGPHVTINGDHPAMNDKARKSYSPAQDAGADAEAWHNRATEKQFTGSMWTNVGGEGIFPNLNNPYIPKPFGDYTMKGEKGVDKDNGGEGTWQDSNTWPNLTNPNVPKAETPKSYKMKNGPETDLVVDK
jgi:hypothetical protein